MRHLLTSFAALCITILACDPTDQASPEPRYWPPEEIEIEGKLETPLDLVPLFNCFKSDQRAAAIDYGDTLILYPDDSKDIHFCVSTRGHEDIADCWRKALLELGAEVKP